MNKERNSYFILNSWCGPQPLTRNKRYCEVCDMYLDKAKFSKHLKFKIHKHNSSNRVRLVQLIRPEKKGFSA
jgi:hypothetical protein